MNSFTNPYFIGSLVCAIVALVIFFTMTGFHPMKHRVIAVVLVLGLVLLAYFSPLVGLGALIVISVAYLIWYFTQKKSLQNDSGNWIPVSEFEKNYQENDTEESGCYVFLVFDKDVSDGNYKNYEKAFVGNSKQIKKEIHKVINNALLSKVYKAIEEGKHVYVSIFPCKETMLDSTQQKLIELYHGEPYLLSFKEVRQKQAVKR